MLKGSCMRLAVSFLWVCFVVAMHRLAAKHTAASYCRCGYQKRGDIVAELLSQCTVKHYIFHYAHLSHVRYNTALPRFCSGGKTSAAWSKKSQGWSDWPKRLRLTVMGDGCCTATEPSEIGGYLFQQMELCTFSTVIRD